MHTTRTIGREIGTALAVLAIYLLTLLAPLHQARANQLDFDALGYATTQSGWVLCTAAGTTGDSDQVLVSKCPAAGIGKQDLVEPNLAPIALLPRFGVLDAPRLGSDRGVIGKPASPPTGSRGPPVVI